MLRNDSETRNGTQAPFLRGTSDPHQVTLRMLTGKTRISASSSREIIAAPSSVGPDGAHPLQRQV